jgi:restriction endonuclease Mrr
MPLAAVRAGVRRSPGPRPDDPKRRIHQGRTLYDGLEQAVGREWSYRGYTVNLLKYRDDPRLHLEPTHVWVRRPTETGKKVLAEKPAEIDMKYLRRYPAYVAFCGKKQDDGQAVQATPSQTPEELLENGYQTLREALAAELLEQVMSCSSTFFERLVVELLVAMGYGGSIEDAGKAVGKTADGGIDGRIKEDKLGLDEIVIQVKRWAGPVGRPEIQSFAGSMEGCRAKKGVFITTSTFSQPALEPWTSWAGLSARLF